MIQYRSPRGGNEGQTEQPKKLWEVARASEWSRPPGVSSSATIYVGASGFYAGLGPGSSFVLTLLTSSYISHRALLHAPSLFLTRHSCSDDVITRRIFVNETVNWERDVVWMGPRTEQNQSELHASQRSCTALTCLTALQMNCIMGAFTLNVFSLTDNIEQPSLPGLLYA